MILKQLLKYKLLEYSIELFFNKVNINFLTPHLIRIVKGDKFKEIIISGTSFKNCVIVKDMGHRKLFNETFNLIAFKHSMNNRGVPLPTLITVFTENCKFIK